MSDKSKIEWTDSTWNPITGCTPASEGCRNCYAKAMAERFPRVHSGDGAIRKFSDVTFHPERLDQPLRWRKPRKIFVCSMGDLFHSEAYIDWLSDIWDIMIRCPQHTFLILTKRADNMRSLLSPPNPCLPTLPNVWLGVTCENQRTANERIPILLDTPAAMRFVSVEPMLEEINIKHYLECNKSISECHARPLYPDCNPITKLCRNNVDWVICGAETGAHKRPCKPEWIDFLRQQCAAAGVPFFGKKDSQGQAIMPRQFPASTKQP